MKRKLFLLLIIVLNLKGLAQTQSPVILKSLTDSFTYSELGFRRNFPIADGDTMAFGTNYYANVLNLNTQSDSIAVRFNPKLKPYRQSTLVHIISPKSRQVVYLNFNEMNCWFTLSKGGDANSYPSPMAVFNEYMTHAIFLLYAFDSFKGEDFAVLKKDRESLMVEHRRYIKFREFSNKLLELYSGRLPEQTVKDLFPLMIDWCKEQN